MNNFSRMIFKYFDFVKINLFRTDFTNLTDF
jgi:hypothetical protein